jgi:hypothetical protein
MSIGDVGRNKKRFGMYLSLSASISLWLVGIGIEGIDWAAIFLDPLIGETPATYIVEIGIISFFLATILYEWRGDEWIDVRLQKRVVEALRAPVAYITVLFAPALSVTWKSVEDDSQGIIDQFFGEPFIQTPLWDYKLGVFTGITILLVTVRYYSLIGPVVLILGLITCLSIFWTSIRRKTWKELPEKILSKAIYHHVRDMYNSSVGLVAEFGKEFQSHEKLHFASESILTFIEDQIKPEIKQLEQSKGNWNILGKKTSQITNRIRNTVHAPFFSDYLRAALSNVILTAFCELIDIEILQEDLDNPRSQGKTGNGKFAMYLYSLFNLLYLTLDTIQRDEEMKDWFKAFLAQDTFEDWLISGYLLAPINHVRLQERTRRIFKTFFNQLSNSGQADVLRTLYQSNFSIELLNIIYNAITKRGNDPHFYTLDFVLTKCEEFWDMVTLSEPYIANLYSYLNEVLNPWPHDTFSEEIVPEQTISQFKKFAKKLLSEKSVPWEWRVGIYRIGDLSSSVHQTTIERDITTFLKDELDALDTEVRELVKTNPSDFLYYQFCSGINNKTMDFMNEYWKIVRSDVIPVISDLLHMIASYQLNQRGYIISSFYGEEQCSKLEVYQKLWSNPSYSRNAEDVIDKIIFLIGIEIENPSDLATVFNDVIDNCKDPQNILVAFCSLIDSLLQLRPSESSERYHDLISETLKFFVFYTNLKDYYIESDFKMLSNCWGKLSKDKLEPYLPSLRRVGVFEQLAK